MKIETSKQDRVVFFAVLVTAALVSCQGLYTGTVTLTQVVDSATIEYAHAYNSGFVPAETANRVAVAYEAYRRAAGVAHDALVAYKQTGAGDTSNAIQTAKQAASQLIDLIVPFLTAEKASQVKAQLSKANVP